MFHQKYIISLLLLSFYFYLFCSSFYVVQYYYHLILLFINYSQQPLCFDNSKSIECKHSLGLPRTDPTHPSLCCIGVPYQSMIIAGPSLVPSSSSLSTSSSPSSFLRLHRALKVLNVFGQSCQKRSFPSVRHCHSHPHPHHSTSSPSE